jgi:lysophospholipase L1-like esterase
MKKVVLLGDSIRLLGYGARTAELLGPDYTVWQPEDNCRFAAYTLRMLFDYQNQLKGADVIHFNCGLWDVCDLFGDGAFTPLEDYLRIMARIAAILKSYAPTVIFATTTTPDPEMPGHDINRLRIYNEAAVATLAPMGILINDLFTPVAADTAAMICPDHIHLSEQGIEVCAAQVADCIRRASEA